ncbi:BUD22 family protein [Taphrina deformans PYCC 5710]|uniref:BUD22 family protein n=1 Tax=Taphrina deformans (strain PYCC 5710 / ATCC 11124 / CBS 356.35 / IMI 108563 / JCM 9778 / NBRC 8474) TaxID=1097556 RepID=R4XBU4_TAPDE|nr:BUD22 family protein [Taphrina deformans PYCC 5710]|eukprot:CCG83335.2 BUD22 family protein [Taphrina deformans PYCC 5710]
MEEILGLQTKTARKQKSDVQTRSKLSRMMDGETAINDASHSSDNLADTSDEERENRGDDDDVESVADHYESLQAPLNSQQDPSQKSSTFLPSLQSGYLPALNDSDDEGELKGLFPAQKKERKNRRGQRARRKILEAKHGNKANHLIKEREAAQKEYEERVARRAAKEAERTGSNAIAIEEAERNRKERREAMLRPIHGSWAVAKAQKQKMLHAKPLGTKISFE